MKAYVNKLREACSDVTQVQFQGMIHDFVLLNSLNQTNACREATDASDSWINRKNQYEMSYIWEKCYIVI